LTPPRLSERIVAIFAGVTKFHAEMTLWDASVIVRKKWNPHIARRDGFARRHSPKE